MTALPTLSRLPRLSRGAALLVAAGAVLAVGGTSTAWVLDTKTVHLSVDGTVRDLNLHGDTVADVLGKAGLKAGQHDLLVPAAGTHVSDGDSVALRRGRELKLVVDGVARSVWVTADDVDEALDQIGLRADGAALSSSRSRAIGLDGLSLEIRMPKNVTIVSDNATTPRVSTAANVGDLLAEAGVPLRPADTVDAALAAPVTEGLVVTVSRIDTRDVTEDVAVAYPTVRTPDPAAYVGTERVTRAGRSGSERRTYTLTTVNGVESARTLSSTVRTAEPTPQLVSVGSKPKPAAPPASPGTAAPPPSSGGSAGGLDWAALARCESGGNPRAVSSNGLYFGLYQFSLSTWASVGGSGRPSDASPAEQTSRAQMLYARSGRSPWPVCGRYL